MEPTMLEITSQDYSFMLASQANLELVKCSCKSIKVCRPGVVERKPTGPALNFANATVSSELYFCSCIAGVTLQ